MVNPALGFAANVLSFLTEQKMISINRLQNWYSTTLLRQLSIAVLCMLIRV